MLTKYNAMGHGSNGFFIGWDSFIKSSIYLAVSIEPTMFLLVIIRKRIAVASRNVLINKGITVIIKRTEIITSYIASIMIIIIKIV